MLSYRAFLIVGIFYLADQRQLTDDLENGNFDSSA